MDERNTPGALADAISDQAGKIEEAILVLRVLMDHLDRDGQIKGSSVAALTARELEARYDALFDIAERVRKLEPSRSVDN